MHHRNQTELKGLPSITTLQCQDQDRTPGASGTTAQESEMESVVMPRL